jgi:hypothetical protein
MFSDDYAEKMFKPISFSGGLLQGFEFDSSPILMISV